jgi:hypothetical protein
MDIATLTAKAIALRQRFAAAAREKGEREWSREEVMQGFVVDVGDLMKLVMARSGIREVEEVDRKLAHELADCFWSVLVLAKLYDVDIEKAFDSMIEVVSADLASKTEPNQAPEPTPTAVTPPAGQEARQP